MAINPRIFVMGEGIGVRGGNFNTTAGLYEIYGPDRLCDTPISERGFVGLACGAAMTGTRPVVDFMFADFILDSFGEIVNQIAKMQYMSSGRLKMPVLLRGCIGIGHSAATHHSGSYYAMYAQVPGLRVVVPSNAYDAKGLMKHALRCDDPVVFFEPKAMFKNAADMPDDWPAIPFGKAERRREGNDVTIVSWAQAMPAAIEAAGALASQGIEADLLDLRTLWPWDREAVLASAARTGRALVVQEGVGASGFGAEVAATIAEHSAAKVRRLASPRIPVPFAPTLEEVCFMRPSMIVAAAKEMVAG
jgi:2-oxoisovalerate dehydrogenase E1 component